MNPSEAVLYANIAALLQAARQTVVQTVNQTMVHTYYEIGHTIVEDEQNGASRAEYGKQTLKNLSKKLTTEFGKGFSERNFRTNEAILFSVFNFADSVCEITTH